MPVTFGRSISQVKKQISTFESTILFRLQKLTMDISYWKELIDRIDRTVVYLESKLGVMEVQNAKTSEEIRVQLDTIEVLTFSL